MHRQIGPPRVGVECSEPEPAKEPGRTLRSTVANYEPGSNGGRDRGGKLQRMQHQLRAQAPPLKPLIDAEARHHDRRHRHAVQVELHSDPTGRRACTLNEPSR